MYVLQIAKAHFMYSIWFMISEISISSKQASSLSKESIQKNLCTTISNSFSTKINFMCTCDFCRYEHVRNFKTLLEENCAVDLGSCYLLTKKC